MRSIGVKEKNDRYGEYNYKTGKLLGKTKDDAECILIPDSLPSTLKITGLKESILYCCFHIL